MVVARRPLPPSRRPLRTLLVLVAATATVAVALPVLGNHPQPSTQNGATFSVEFDHDGDNQWWVEFQARAAGGDAIILAETKVEGSTEWRGMNFAANDYERQQQGWSKFAPEQAFQVPTGKRVMFRVHLIDDATGNAGLVQSCWFTHPAGVEQCGTSTTTTTSSTTTTTGTTFNAPFTGVRGNAWWIQANVGTNGPPIAKVDATTDGGRTWKPLARQSWGPTAWAASFHIPDGTIVQLRATATTGVTDLSSCRQWIPPSGQDAAIVACGSSPPPGAFDATFSGVKGNDWWVQVNVAANQPVAGVGVRVDCRPDWIPLTRQSWGGWTASFHIPPGSKVDFQARTATFASDVSGGYTWPAATAASGCPQGDWPRQGSTAAYSLSSGVCGGGECFSDSARLDMLYRDGRWVNTCRGESRHTTPDGGETVRTWTSDNSGIAPSWLTPRTQAGAQVRPDMFHAGDNGCSMGWTSSWLTVTGQVDHQTNLRDASGNPVTLRAWEAVSDGANGDNIYTAHWDVDTGLVLDVASNPRMSGQGSAYMTLIGTDAGLR